MLAANLTMAGLTLVMAYVNKILLPLYAQTARENRASFPDVFYSSKRRMTLALAFIFGGGIGGGDLIVRVSCSTSVTLRQASSVSLLCARPLALLVSHSAEQAIIILGRVRSALEANRRSPDLDRNRGAAWVSLFRRDRPRRRLRAPRSAGDALLVVAAIAFRHFQTSRRKCQLCPRGGDAAPRSALQSTAGVETLIARGALPNF